MKIYTNIPTGSELLKRVAKQLNLKRVIWLQFPEVDAGVNRISHKKAIELSRFFIAQGMNFLVVEANYRMEGNPDSKELLFGDFTVEKRLLLAYHFKDTPFQDKALSISKGTPSHTLQYFHNIALTGHMMEQACISLEKNLSKVFA